jgi:unsaturated chondroitin disaccharide hydrolase
MSDFRSDILDALHFAQSQVRRLINNHPGFFPLYTCDGRWFHDQPAWTRWCDGFLPGLMWLFLESHHPDDPDFWRYHAQSLSAALEHRKEDRDVHDLGFIFYHGTFRRWYEASLREGKPDDRLRQVLIRAGQILSLRFQPHGRYLASFISDESLFIDIMMNVPIIFYAARESADENLLRVAQAHCNTTRRALVRGDGSTAHEGIFDPITGEFLRQTTHQGFRGDSCWSRGLAWSIYGFTTCHELTHTTAWLSTAEANAAYWLEHIPADGVPPWDFDHPGLPASAGESDAPTGAFLPDSSAAAIAASGLLDLARLTHDPARAAAYRNAAFQSLRTLLKPPYLAIDDPKWEGILKGGVYHVHKGLGIEESVMWGEFFFIEALVKALALIDA